MNVRRWLLGVALVVTACGGESGVPPPPALPETPLVGRSQRTEPAPVIIDPELDAALNVVARVRELPMKKSVGGEVLGRDAMIGRLDEKLREEVEVDRVEGESEVLFGLDLVGADFDYLGSLRQLLTAHLAGFYDPDTKQMVMAADLKGAAREATLFHELVHALQDQHFDLSKLDQRDRPSDEVSALHVLAEGDATSAMFDAMFIDTGKTALSMPQSLLTLQMRAGMAVAAQDVPPVLGRSLIAPYADGLEVVHRLRRQGGWSAVDAVWRDPPSSTEQLLHGDKLAAREAPENVPSPPATNGWKVGYDDVFGEQTVRIVLEEWLPRRTAVEGAAGWAGDRVTIYRRGSERLLRWRVRYDDVALARRGLQAWVRAVLSSDPTQRGKLPWVSRKTARPHVKAGFACRERRGRGPLAVALDGRVVEVLAGPWRGRVFGPQRGAAPSSKASCQDARALLGGP